MPKKNQSFLFFFICAVLLFVCSCVTHSQIRKMPFRTLNGLVVDANGKPLKGVTVTTDPPTSALLTNDLGEFLITGLPEGTYTIHLVKQGFLGNSTLIAVKGFGPIHVDIQLAKKIITSPIEQEKLMPKIHHKHKEKGTYNL